jgi:hypothetical protein
MTPCVVWMVWHLTCVYCTGANPLPWAMTYLCWGDFALLWAI